MIASQLLQDGYEVRLKSTESGIMNLDFEISGKGKNQMDQQMDMEQQQMGAQQGMDMGDATQAPEDMGMAEEGMEAAPVPEGQPGLGGAKQNQTGQMDPDVPEMRPNVRNAFMNKFQLSKTMVQQVIEKGHVPAIQDVNDNQMWFKSDGRDWIANFTKGTMTDIQPAHFPKDPGDAALNRHQNAIYQPENPEGADDLSDLLE